MQSLNIQQTFPGGEGEKEKQAGRQTDRHTERDTNRGNERERHTYKQRVTERENGGVCHYIR